MIENLPVVLQVILAPFIISALAVFSVFVGLFMLSPLIFVLNLLDNRDRRRKKK